ncbi:uncharacterized protein L3040_009021 [Drepanopeziza brunnea f. sp. 'multigermtubi']|uniref:uncharacterized protein n=1 Tax=Drepanopeziza brunnea f. sp. 'multigermtubi' TaxID=698441 RepID=UPI0023A684ED|nr:hypothetical protein L3040_009021 [Drepanopeziza brunnea f. sp. 'multigermtubi']
MFFSPDLIVLACWASTAVAGQVTFRNSHKYYFDVDGNAIDSVNGKVEWIQGQYLWIGEPSSCGAEACDKVSWSSPNLIDWYFNGPLFNLTENAQYCLVGLGSCSRPKVIYNEKTRKYVFYGFATRGSGPATVPVFTSDSLTSGYTFAGEMIPDYAPAGWSVEDLGLTVLDGKAYLTFTGWNITSMYSDGHLGSIWPPFINPVLVQPLSEDFLQASGRSYPVHQAGTGFPIFPDSPNLIDGQFQSPDLFRRGDTYYVIGSGTCSFCPGTTTLAYRSSSPFGPWTRQIVDCGNTCGGQAMGVLNVPPVAPGAEGAFVYHADSFSTAPMGGHITGSKGHAFWPLSFASDGSIEPIDCSANKTFTIDAPPATAPFPRIGGRAVNATDGSGNYGAYYSETGLITKRFLYQTWTSSKSGMLTEVGVNLALNAPAPNPITIVVFSYPDEATLLSPAFRWTELATKLVADTTDRSFLSFQVQRIEVNQEVQAGQRLGIALFSAQNGPRVWSLPYAYLVQDTAGTGTNHKLYAIEKGHISRDGPKGQQSPLKEVVDREIKWYATVV